MILQLHWQYPDGTTTIRAQKDFTGDYKNKRDAIISWLRETQETFPLPNNAVWMMCTEKSKYFQGVAKELA